MGEIWVHFVLLDWLVGDGCRRALRKVSFSGGIDIDRFYRSHSRVRRPSLVQRRAQVIQRSVQVKFIVLQLQSRCLVEKWLIQFPIEFRH